MTGLHTDRRGQFRKAQVERRELDFGAAFQILVGEGLADAVGREIDRIGERDLVVLVIGIAHQYRIVSTTLDAGRNSPLPITLSWRASMRPRVPSPSGPGMP